MKKPIFSGIYCVGFLTMVLVFAGFVQSSAAVTNELEIAAEDTSVNRDPKKYFVNINATIRDSKGPEKADEKVTIQGVIIKILNENDYLIASYFTDKKGKSNFTLPLDKRYKILIAKRGYVTKIVEIDTRVPRSVMSAYDFPVDIAIFADIKDLDTSVLKNPIARVTFDPRQNQFVYDISYTHKINGDLKKLYKQYYQLTKGK